MEEALARGSFANGKPLGEKRETLEQIGKGDLNSPSSVALDIVFQISGYLVDVPFTP